MRKSALLSTFLVLLLVINLVFSLPAFAAEQDNTLKVMDLQAFLNQFHDTKVKYDLLKMATALQGIVNRTGPKIFYLFDSSSDSFWYNELSKDGQILSQYAKSNVSDLFSLVQEFKGSLNGVVLWDEKVPATANVASTAAGVENLLPVRFDESPGSLYHELFTVRRIFTPEDVKLNLTGKFTGQGTIPDIGEPSTGSAKNDAYLWAKARYLDTGLTNPTLMTYSLDAISWNLQGGVFDANLLSAHIPRSMQKGTEAEITIVLENTGETPWSPDTLDRLGSLGDNQFLWSNLNGGFSLGANSQRVFLSPGVHIAKGEKATFRFTLIAPDQPGSYTFSAKMVRDGVAWYGDDLIRTIQVTEEGPLTYEDISNVGEAFYYPDLSNTNLPNTDYYIANKAFFFDLSPDPFKAPNDDRSQPIGTDVNTLNKILRAQSTLAGRNIITIGGFVPWWLKYTTYVDPGATYEPVQAEWKFVDIASQYNCQLDADAYGLICLTNASIYQQVPLREQYTQRNDKGNNGKVYDSSKKYVLFYMADYDSAAWSSRMLPTFWNDPKRGELPLEWSFGLSLSNRIPQLFNYLYDTMSPNDYFVSSDNGTDYLNPMMLLEENRPEGLPEFLDVWEAYNTQYFRKFDIDITGFLIAGNTGYVPLQVQEAYSRISPSGVSVGGYYEKAIVNETPFLRMGDFSFMESDPAVYGEKLAKTLQGGQQFYNLRMIFVSPTVICGAVDYVKQHYPELNFEVVDPYTFFRFYKTAVESQVELQKPVYEAPRSHASPIVDGVVREEEWADAQDITIRPESEYVKKFGAIWGEVTDGNDLTSRYRIKWDEQNLYLLEQRQDDSVQFTENGPALYFSDASMVCLDLNGKKQGTQYLDGDYSLMATPKGPDGNAHVFLREGHDGGDRTFEITDQVHIASTITENGYVMELAIPWSNLQVTPFSPSEGMTVGMMVLATDNDGPGQWGQIIWVGDGDLQSSWPDIRFTVTPAPTPKEQCEKLVQAIQAMDCGNGTKTPLLASLDRVMAFLDRADSRFALQQIDVLTKKVEEFQANGKLTSAQADALLASIAKIRKAIQ